LYRSYPEEKGLLMSISTFLKEAIIYDGRHLLVCHILNLTAQIYVR